ncbi:LysR family transcriptional regulator [Rhodospirillum rubrum]|uniref:Transcriptional regulator, LysR family n=1 Tax=Rhodospirillum rubrum (strain ATCC 11170 / ATH 1.1.1 / DSM 467 / LMG 4362 / NCIMB 8255 / S1) TaxID=269796 RepID=Q2RTU3_RHORT|nr:LysR family transcriptional regulator [Rhodospirillum rubrum]ABC22452.1 transcriptional regulator, LysR family [Rhodospirillum rubrum ATCC 11170]AEO48169.1 LysR family transcriptional regulator [Rhodospirillum rubrum F11]MBK5954034.1 LysR family transcriptional regulator [Rhodospirillum rubrum]QXG82084.1 LysR family transcriptional regulator [Rhodospirillum rubrum]HAQ00121.1 LysR family transcriptional regulator [Rhodospirillum rubrum]
MDLAALAVFRTVAREQSVTRAAELLGRVPSNVTTRVQQLEAEIGVALFQRDKKRMVLTAAGETYLDYAERILNLAEEAQQRVKPLAPFGTLRVGSMECAVASRLPAPLARYSAAWPQVRIELTTAPTRPLIEAVLARRIDCALIALPSGEGWLGPTPLDTVPVFREDLVLLLPHGHPEVHTAEDIKPRTLATFAPGCTYRGLAEDWLTDQGRRQMAFAIQEVRSYHAMFACTAAGSCVSVMPRGLVELMDHREAVEEKPLRTVDTYLASRPGFATSAFAAFRETLGEFSDFKEEGDGAG